MTPPALYGLVLIGGKSTRMGRDKSLLEYHGKNQREYCYSLLDRLCQEVFFSCNQAQSATLQHPFIVDKMQDCGPISGLLAAFEKYPDVAWMILACDMPRVNSQLLKMLLSHRNPEQLATCFYHDFPEPLCAIWEPSAFPKLQDYISKGHKSPRHFLEINPVQLIKADDALKEKLENINTPEQANVHPPGKTE